MFISFAEMFIPNVSKSIEKDQMMPINKSDVLSITKSKVHLQAHQNSNDYAIKSLIDDLNIRDKHKSPIVLTNINRRHYITPNYRPLYTLVK